jgi:hypothetical protein
MVEERRGERRAVVCIVRLERESRIGVSSRVDRISFWWLIFRVRWRAGEVFESELGFRLNLGLLEFGLGLLFLLFVAVLVRELGGIRADC